MRKRLVLVGVLAGSPLLAQLPPPLYPPPNPPPPAFNPLPSQPMSPAMTMPRPNSTGLPYPASPGFPGGLTPPGSPMFPNPGGYRPASPATPAPTAMPLPNPFARPQPALPDGSVPVPFQIETPLPYPEAKIAIDPGAVTMKRINGSWQVWAGPRLLKELGDQQESAKDVVQVLRDMRATEWASIGGPRPIVEYGLVNGRPPLVAFPRSATPIDLRTVHVEPLKGVWVLRDDDNILFNFGLRKQDADQALAVVRRYGFNRVGTVGQPAPVMTFFFVSLEPEKELRPRAPNAGLAAVLQESNLTRTGIPVPGVGFVGEMVKIDPRKIEVCRDRAEWVVACGPEVLGRFGPSEWMAHDAKRLVEDGRFTEFCRAGSVTFFLVDGKAPMRVPLSVQGQRFSTADLKVQQVGPKLSIADAGRPLFDVATAEEGEAVIRMLKHFQFEQLCQMGPSPKTGLMFLARGR